MKKTLYLLILVSMTSVTFAKPTLLPDFTTLVKQTGAAVVNITARHEAKEIQNQQQIPQNPFGNMFKTPRNPQDRDSVSAGSGFIISSDGYILTNRHVIHGADNITVRLVDRREFDAELIGEDEASDIALLKVDAKHLPVLKIGDASKVEIGQWVMAIGSPMSFEHSVTKGIVSAKGRAVGRQQYVPFIQTDVPINPGNSGGPLINMNGEVVGINSMIVSNSGGYMGLSFSIPIDVAMSVMKQLKTSGVVKRGLLGVNIQPVTQKMADYLGLTHPKGALVANVNKGSSAEKAGVRVQDVIVKFNGLNVETSSSLPPLVGSVQPGTKVSLGIVRDGKMKVLKAVLGGLDTNEVLDDESTLMNKHSELGFEIANISDEMKQQFEIQSGIVVKSISSRDIQRAGLKANDIILKLAKTTIKNTRQFTKLISKLEKNEPIVLLVKQNGANRFIIIERE